MNKNMSCYRRFTDNSWTVNVGKDNDKFVNSLKQYIPFLIELNKYRNERDNISVILVRTF